MYINLKFSIEIDRNKYPKLTKAEITQIVKDMEVNGSIVDYIKCESESALSDADFEK